MIWLSWRQFRAQGAALAALVAAGMIVLIVTGQGLISRVRGSAAVYDLLTASDRALFYTGIVALAVIPPILGAFWGAPLLAREIEGGTHRLIWTQTVTRNRWLVARLGLITVASAVLVGALSWAITWWSADLDGAMSSTRGGLPGRLTPISFAMRGVVPVACTVFAIALGAAAGAVLRRSLPAMAVTLALVVTAQVTVPMFLRPHLLPPVTRTVAITPATLDGIGLPAASGPPVITVHTGDRADWIIRNVTVGRSGRAVPVPDWMGTCGPGMIDGAVRAGGTAQPAASTAGSCFERLQAGGFRQRVTYQPAARFWPLQWAESTLYLLAAAALIAFTAAKTGRRNT